MDGSVSKLHHKYSHGGLYSIILRIWTREPFSMWGTYSMRHIDMDPIEYGPYVGQNSMGRPAGPYSIGNMDLGSILHGLHILYDTGTAIDLISLFKCFSKFVLNYQQLQV